MSMFSHQVLAITGQQLTTPLPYHGGWAHIKAIGYTQT